MDEGMTCYISDLAMNKVMNLNRSNPFEGAYRGYAYLAASGKEQPQATHADRFDSNMPYGIAAYNKGEVFMAQLGYVIGEEMLDKTIHEYYEQWQFKHPTPNDFIRVAEKVSGFELDWYLTDWTRTTNTIDYGIKTVEENGTNTKVTLERIGRMPMPIDVVIEYTNGTKEYIYIPLQIARAEKANAYPNLKRTVIKDWAWAYPTYSFDLSQPKSTVKSIVIDPAGLMADVDKTNNSIQKD